MNSKNTKNKFKLVLSVGDESGIGPEIILKALCSDKIPKDIDFILVGSRSNLQNTYTHLQSLGLVNLANPKDLHIHDIKISSSNNCSKLSFLIVSTSLTILSLSLYVGRIIEISIFIIY